MSLKTMARYYSEETVQQGFSCGVSQAYTRRKDGKSETGLDRIDYFLTYPNYGSRPATNPIINYR